MRWHQYIPSSRSTTPESNKSVRGLIDLPSVLAQLQATTFYASQSLYDAVLARDAARKANRPTDGR